MITKHLRLLLSLCPKQAKGVTGVQGQVRSEPLQLINGNGKAHPALRLQAVREMRVVSEIKRKAC